MAALLMFMVSLALAALGIVVWMLLPLVSQAVATNQRAACGNNMKLIAMALHSYHDAYGSFPPAYLADARRAVQG